MAGEVPFGTSTSLAVVATTARMDKGEALRVAMMAQDGLARAIRPSHTPFDGDTVFVMATGETEAAVHLVGSLAAEGVAGAIRSAVRNARSAGGVPASCDILKSG